MQFLRTNTATRITVGPFLDKTDGVTPETAITVTSCKLMMTVDDGGVPTLVLDTAPTASGGANDMVHITGDDAGYYDLELAAANVNYLGRAKLAITDAAVHCPVFMEFMILPAVVYDSFVLGTDVFQVDVTQFGGSNLTSASGIPEVKVNNIAANAITTASINDGAITDAKVADDVKVDVNTIKGQTVTLAGGVTIPAATLASTTNITAGTIATVSGNVNGNVGGNVTGTVGSVVGAVGSVTGAVGSVTGNVGGNVTGSVGSVAAGGITAASIATDAIDADALAADAVTEIATGVWGFVVQGTRTATKAVRLMLAALTGKASGLGTATAVYRNPEDTIDAISASVDASGNRTAVTLDDSA